MISHMDILNMIVDRKSLTDIAQMLEKYREQEYNKGFKAGSNDARSRDYSARYGHDMGQ